MLGGHTYEVGLPQPANLMERLHDDADIHLQHRMPGLLSRTHDTEGLCPFSVQDCRQEDLLRRLKRMPRNDHRRRGYLLQAGGAAHPQERAGDQLLLTRQVGGERGAYQVEAVREAGRRLTSSLKHATSPLRLADKCLRRAACDGASQAGKGIAYVFVRGGSATLTLVCQQARVALQDRCGDLPDHNELGALQLVEQAVLLPYLRSQGLNIIDRVVISLWSAWLRHGEHAPEYVRHTISVQMSY